MYIFLVILALVVLITLHELGHFLVAKKYGVKVEEFGIGIPPRAWGKKIGETIYSLNWVPLGGFVKLYGEDKRIEDERSFSSKPIYQRALILFAGVAAFFVLAVIIFSIVVSTSGVRFGVSDKQAMEGGWHDPQIIITEVQEGSPAYKADIMMGDVIKEVNGKEITREEELFELVESAGEKEIELKFKRGEEIKTAALTPRPLEEGEDPKIGIGFIRTANFVSPPHLAPFHGMRITGLQISGTLRGFGMLFSSVISPEKELPPGMEFGGPVKIVGIGAREAQRGLFDFLEFIGLITVTLAIINSLPIPALDGGRLLFLAVEKIKGKPISQNLEYGLNGAFFVLLLLLMMVVTFYDISDIFNS